MAFDPRSASTFVVGGGGVAVTTFAPDALPEFWRLVGFWGGLSAMALGLLWMGWLYAGPYIRLPMLTVRWRDGVAGRASRFPLMEILDMARAEGWVFDDKSLHLLDLADALRQGGIDGSIKFWGRAWDGRFEQSVRREPLVEIPADHWKDYGVDAISLGYGDDNFGVSSYISGSHTKGYADLHIGDSKRVEVWLKSEAVHYRGKRKR